jgi:hypothetical protein
MSPAILSKPSCPERFKSAREYRPTISAPLCSSRARRRRTTDRLRLELLAELKALQIQVAMISERERKES